MVRISVGTTRIIQQLTIKIHFLKNDLVYCSPYCSCIRFSSLWVSPHSSFYSQNGHSSSTGSRYKTVTMFRWWKVIPVLYKDSWRSTPQWGLQSPPNIHEHTYPKENIVIDTKIVEIRKPQAELAETMCLCWHLPHLLHHRHMVTPPRAFVKFWTLPNYLSVTNLNHQLRLSRLSSNLLHSRGALGPSKMNRASSVLWQKHVKWCE